MPFRKPRAKCVPTSSNILILLKLGSPRMGERLSSLAPAGLIGEDLTRPALPAEASSSSLTDRGVVEDSDLASGS
jgi:hypothetical protein